MRDITEGVIPPITLILCNGEIVFMACFNFWQYSARQLWHNKISRRFINNFIHIIFMSNFFKIHGKPKFSNRGSKLIKITI